MHTRLNGNARLFLCLFVGISCSVVFSQPLRAAGADDLTPDRVDVVQVQVQRIVDDLKARLEIPHPVTVSIVERNPLMASVAPVSGGGFALSLEAGFADRLTEDELTAAIAHELGHVWIYTHFPFLQTEQLANEIAMRVVSRESLVPLYAQMFERVRVDGDLSHYLSDTHVDH
jgi:predicted Zn-dependent protease